MQTSDIGYMLSLAILAEPALPACVMKSAFAGYAYTLARAG